MSSPGEQDGIEQLLALIDAEDQQGIQQYLAAGGDLKPALDCCLGSRMYLQFLKKELPDTADIFESASIGDEIETVPEAGRILALLRLAAEKPQGLFCTSGEYIEAVFDCALLKLGEGAAYFEYDEYLKARKAWQEGLSLVDAALSLIKAAGLSAGTEGDSPRILFSTQSCKEGAG